MALVKCKECGSKVSTKAAACPQYGAKISKGIGCGDLIVVVCMVFLIVGVGVNTPLKSKFLTVIDLKDKMRKLVRL